jgi:hypothetical protein
MIYLKYNFYNFIMVLFIILMLFDPISADGGFFPVKVEQMGNSAESPNQRAIIIYNENMETMILQVKFSGNAIDFAWVVPVASLPEENSIQLESDSIFTQLHDMTQPKVYRYNSAKLGGGGHRGWDNSEPIEEINNAQIQVWQNASVGPYEVNVISGNSSQALKDWLNAHGYNYAQASDEILDFYIQKKWYFMATKVIVDDQPADKNTTYQAGLPALKVSFSAEEPVFPLRISEISSAKNNEIEIYVAANHRMISDSYNSYAMDRNEVEQQIKDQIWETNLGNSGLACACKRETDPLGESSSNYDYEFIFRNKLYSLDDRTVIIEYAGQEYTSWDYEQYPNSGTLNGFFNTYFEEGSDFWITRFRTILSPEDMTDDVTFIPDPAGDEYLYLHFAIETQNPWEVSVIGIPLLFLIPLVFSSRIRKQYWKHSVISIAILYLFML